MDKVYHFAAGFIIAGLVTMGFTLFWGIVAGLIAGTAKELYDEYTYGGGDFFDFFATAGGAFISAILVEVINVQIG